MSKSTAAQAIGMSTGRMTLRHIEIKGTCRTVCGRDFSGGNIRLVNPMYPEQAEATCSKCLAAK